MDEIKLTTEEQKIINSAKEVSLSMSEKNDIKNNLISYTNTHPVVVPKKTKFFTFGSLYQSGIYLVPAIAVVLLVIGLNTTDNNSGQIASIETIDTNISNSVPAPEAFTTMSAPAGSVESASFAEPKMADEPSNARMMKSAPAESAVMMMSASVDTSTTTATSTSKKNSVSSVSRIKYQINETYKSFVNRFFTKNKKEDKKESKEEDKKEEKKTEEKRDDDKKVSKSGNDSYNDRNEIERENEREIEDDDDKDEDRSNDDVPVVDPLPPIIKATTTVTSTTTVPETSVISSYTLLQVAIHNKSTDCWSVVSGNVYNLTSWIAKHPGGEAAIKSMCGLDATVGFLAQHNGDTKAVNTLASYKIGLIK